MSNKRILFDARMLGEGFGIGTYIKELILRLPVLGSDINWIILVNEAGFPLISDEIKNLNNVEVVKINIKHYSIAEQLQLPKIIQKYKPDLVHFPNFNVPILFKGNFATTIHDMVHHELPGQKKARFLHRFAYRKVIEAAVNNSKAIISVSAKSKKDILTYFKHIDDKKIFVIYEGVDSIFTDQQMPGEFYTLKEKYNIEPPFLLFVGVWELKKNLPYLAKAFAAIAEDFPELKLVLAGKEDASHPEVVEMVKNAAGKYWPRILKPGFVAAEDLPALYKNASVFVNASTYEGFGLPGLEAMASGTPVAVADTEVFKEVYQKAAVYFDPSIPEDAAVKIKKILNNQDLRSKLVKQGKDQVKKYTWEDTCTRTLKLYNSLINE